LESQKWTFINVQKRISKKSFEQKNGGLFEKPDLHHNDVKHEKMAKRLLL